MVKKNKRTIKRKKEKETKKSEQETKSAAPSCLPAKRKQFKKQYKQNNTNIIIDKSIFGNNKISHQSSLNSLSPSNTLRQDTYENGVHS